MSPVLHFSIFKPSADDVQNGIPDDPAIGDEDEDVYLGLSVCFTNKSFSFLF